jgi:hypothetical protein
MFNKAEAVPTLGFVLKPFRNIDLNILPVGLR